MEDQIKNILSSMKVRDNKEDAEQKAYDIYKLGSDALKIIIKCGFDLSERELDEKIKNQIRAVIFTIFVFYFKNKTAFEDSIHHSSAIELLILLSLKGFSSAKKNLSEMGFSEYDIYRKQLLSLPIMDKHRHDKEISTREAYEEISLSRSYTGRKGFFKDRYSLGSDNKHVYEIYRIGEKLFVLRTLRRK